MAPKLPGHIFSVGRTKRYIVQDRAKWHPMEWKHKSIQDGRFVWNISWTAAQPTQFMDNLICDFFGHAIPTPRDHVYSVIRCPCRWTPQSTKRVEIVSSEEPLSFCVLCVTKGTTDDRGFVIAANKW